MDVKRNMIVITIKFITTGIILIIFGLVNIIKTRELSYGTISIIFGTLFVISAQLLIKESITWKRQLVTIMKIIAMILVVTLVLLIIFTKINISTDYLEYFLLASLVALLQLTNEKSL